MVVVVVGVGAPVGAVGVGRVEGVQGASVGWVSPEELLAEVAQGLGHDGGGDPAAAVGEAFDRSYATADSAAAGGIVVKL